MERTESNNIAELNKAILDLKQIFDCPICLELMVNPVSTKCDHKFCRFCILKFVDTNKTAACPLCKVSLTKRSLQDLPTWTLLVNKVKQVLQAYQLESGAEESIANNGTNRSESVAPNNAMESAVVESVVLPNRKRRRNGTTVETSPAIEPSSTKCGNIPEIKEPAEVGRNENFRRKIVSPRQSRRLLQNKRKHKVPRGSSNSGDETDESAGKEQPGTSTALHGVQEPLNSLNIRANEYHSNKNLSKVNSNCDIKNLVTDEKRLGGRVSNVEKCNTEVPLEMKQDCDKNPQINLENVNEKKEADRSVDSSDEERDRCLLFGGFDKESSDKVLPFDTRQKSQKTKIFKSRFQNESRSSRTEVDGSPVPSDPYAFMGSQITPESNKKRKNHENVEMFEDVKSGKGKKPMKSYCRTQKNSIVKNKDKISLEDESKTDINNEEQVQRLIGKISDAENYDLILSQQFRKVTDQYEKNSLKVSKATSSSKNCKKSVTIDESCNKNIVGTDHEVSSSELPPVSHFGVVKSQSEQIQEGSVDMVSDTPMTKFNISERMKCVFKMPGNQKEEKMHNGEEHQEKYGQKKDKHRETEGLNIFDDKNQESKRFRDDEQQQMLKFKDGEYQKRSPLENDDHEEINWPKDGVHKEKNRPSNGDHQKMYMLEDDQNVVLCESEESGNELNFSNHNHLDSNSLNDAVSGIYVENSKSTRREDEVSKSTQYGGEVKKSTWHGSGVSISTRRGEAVNKLTQNTGEVNKLTQNEDEVEKLTQNAGEVNKLTQHREEVSKLTKHGSEVNQLTQHGGEVRKLTRPGGEVNKSTQHGNEVNKFTQHRDAVNKSTQNAGEVSKLTRYGGEVSKLTRHGGEVNIFTQHRDAVDKLTQHGGEVSKSAQHGGEVNKLTQHGVEVTRSTQLEDEVNKLTQHEGDLAENNFVSDTLDDDEHRTSKVVSVLCIPESMEIDGSTDELNRTISEASRNKESSRNESPDSHDSDAIGESWKDKDDIVIQLPKKKRQTFSFDVSPNSSKGEFLVSDSLDIDVVIGEAAKVILQGKFGSSSILDDDFSTQDLETCLTDSRLVSGGRRSLSTEASESKDSIKSEPKTVGCLDGTDLEERKRSQLCISAKQISNAKSCSSEASNFQSDPVSEITSNIKNKSSKSSSLRSKPSGIPCVGDKLTLSEIQNLILDGAEILAVPSQQTNEFNVGRSDVDIQSNSGNFSIVGSSDLSTGEQLTQNVARRDHNIIIGDENVNKSRLSGLTKSGVQSNCENVSFVRSSHPVEKITQNNVQIMQKSRKITNNIVDINKEEPRLSGYIESPTGQTSSSEGLHDAKKFSSPDDATEPASLLRPLLGTTPTSPVKSTSGSDVVGRTSSEKVSTSEEMSVHPDRTDTEAKGFSDSLHEEINPTVNDHTVPDDNDGSLVSCRSRRTSSGNCSTQMEVLTTQQQEELEMDVRKMEEEIAKLEAELGKTSDATKEERSDDNDVDDDDDDDEDDKQSERLASIPSKEDAVNLDRSDSTVLEEMEDSDYTVVHTKKRVSRIESDSSDLDEVKKTDKEDDDSDVDMFGGSEVSDMITEIPQTPTCSQNNRSTPGSQLRLSGVRTASSGAELSLSGKATKVEHNEESKVPISSPRSPTPPPTYISNPNSDKNRPKLNKQRKEALEKLSPPVQSCLPRQSSGDKKLSNRDKTSPTVDKPSGRSNARSLSHSAASKRSSENKRPENTQSTSVLKTKKKDAETDDRSSPAACFPCKPHWVFVASGINRLTEKPLIDEFIATLGCRFQQKFSYATTHVLLKPVSPGSRRCQRTLKYFQGVAYKRWVVSLEWVFDSVKAGKLLPVERYEITGDSAVNVDHFGPANARLSGVPLLHKYEICCLGAFDDLSRDDLRTIVEACGASSLQDPAMFTFDINRTQVIVVEGVLSASNTPQYSKLYRRYHVPIVAKEWILDSVGTYDIKSLDEYMVFPTEEK